MRYIGVFIVFIFMILCWDASAQFSLSKVKPSTVETLKAGDTIKLDTRYSNEFFSRALWQAERRALRKQRNTTELNAALQMSQTQFDNWSAGGDNTFSARSNIFFRYQHKRNRFFLETRFQARYGLNYIEKKRFKNEDEFKANVMSAWDINDHWSYAASSSLRSQFSTSYKSRTDATRVSTFMAPGFLDLSVGFKYARKPFVLVISPIGGNAVFMLDKRLQEEGKNGVPVGKTSKWKVGPSLRAELDWEFAKKVCRLRSYFDAFTNIKTAPVLRLETTFDIRATKYLTTTIYGLAFYDRDSPAPKPRAMQYKYALSVGLSYMFKNK